MSEVNEVADKVKADAAALKSLPPNHEAAAVREADIITGVNLLAGLAKQYVPDAYKPLIAIVVGAVLGGVSAWFTKPATPVPVAPPVVIVQPDASPIVPPVASLKVTLYVSTKEQAAIAADPALRGVTVHPGLFPAGSTYPWQGKAVPVPCAEVKDATGKVLDVREFANAADVVAMMKGAK